MPEPLLTVSFKRRTIGDVWKSIAKVEGVKRRVRLCGDGVKEVLDVPDKAKRLHFTVYGEKLRDAKSVLPIVVESYGGYSIYMGEPDEWQATLDGHFLDKPDIGDVLKGFMLRKETKKTFYVVAEWE